MTVADGTDPSGGPAGEPPTLPRAHETPVPPAPRVAGHAFAIVVGSVVVTILALALAGRLRGPAAPAVPGPSPTQVTGTLECLGCLLAARLSEGPGARAIAPGLAPEGWDADLHARLGLLGAEGRWWRLVGPFDENAEALLGDHAAVGRTVTAFGVVHGDLGVVHATRILPAD